MARILVLGAGFAGLWAAVGAARKLDEIRVAPGEVEILIVDRNPYHNVRVRNYEIDLGNVAIPLGKVLDPIGVKHLAAQVERIDIAKQQVTIATSCDHRSGSSAAVRSAEGFVCFALQSGHRWLVGDRPLRAK